MLVTSKNLLALTKKDNRNKEKTKNVTHRRIICLFDLRPFLPARTL